jgi:hypothetical protein
VQSATLRVVSALFLEFYNNICCLDIEMNRSHTRTSYFPYEQYEISLGHEGLFRLGLGAAFA